MMFSQSSLIKPTTPSYDQRFCERGKLDLDAR